MAAAVQRRLRVQPRAAAATTRRQPVDQTTGVALGVRAGGGVGASRWRVRRPRRGRRLTTGAQLRRPQAAGPARGRAAPHETTTQRTTSRAREAPQGAQEGREKGQEEVASPLVCQRNARFAPLLRDDVPFVKFLAPISISLSVGNAQIVLPSFLLLCLSQSGTIRTVPVCKFNVIFTVNYKNVRATILEYSVLISGLNTIFLLCNAVSCLVLNFFIYIELSTESRYIEFKSI